MNQIRLSAVKSLIPLVLLASPYSALDADFTRRDHYPGLHERNLSRLLYV
jgi:hypothetical protein